MDFYKYHALGNDYIVIDPAHVDILMSTENIKLICDRHFGVGSDGILSGPFFENQKIGLRIYNPDGTEAEKSGNGIRIFSRYLLEARYVSDDMFSLWTKGGRVDVRLIDHRDFLIEVNMGKVTFESSEIPVLGDNREVVEEPLVIDDKTFKITCLSIGNPHCVIIQKSVSEKVTREIGPKIENHTMFPERINVQFLEILDMENVKIEIWERGAGYTLASGSSSCAAFAAAYRLGLVKKSVRVHMPGGKLEVSIDNEDNIHMTGPVTKIMEGRFAKALLYELNKP
ncbi:MAG: diaminopimelate epimerase [Spirochaetota bacterium]|nr:MAG: diaminopimelate epimerase [Spirochaetota bacterium]